MKILFITDTHLTAKTPASRTDVYEITTLKKFNEIGNIIRANGIERVIHGGDMFHTAKVSLRYAGHIAEIIKSWGVPVNVVPGNHDLYGYNLSTIDQTILGLYARSGVINLLTRDNPLLVDINGSTLAIEGQEYYADIDKGNMIDYRIDTVGADYNILITHSMLLPKPFFPDIPHTLISNVVTDADLVLAGHYHPGFPETINGNTTFINPGATIRVESSRLDIPKVMIIDVDNNTSGGLDVKWDYVELKTAKKREDVFDVANKLAKKHSSQVVTAFKQNIDGLTSLKNANSITDMVSAMSTELQIPKEVSDIAIKHITDAEISEDDINATVNGFIQKNYNLTTKRVHIKNFQSHEDTEIEFKNGMNVITGESNQGKTAVIRAIEWALYNEPKGTDFIRTGENECTVEVEFSDGSSITRSRTRASSGYYKVKDSNGVEKIYKGFGNDIPVEVQNEHQMPDVYITKDIKVKLNLATQLEGPFLIGESPSVRASAIGRLTGVQVLDVAIKNCNRNLLAINKEIKVLDSKIDSFNKELKQYDSLDNMQLYLKIIEELYSTKTVLENDVKVLSNYKDTLNNIESDKKNKILLLSTIPNTENVEKLINEVSLIYNEVQELISYKNELETLIRDKFKCNNIIKYIDEVLESNDLITEFEKLKDIAEMSIYYKSLRSELYFKGNKSKSILKDLECTGELEKIVSDLDNEVVNLTNTVKMQTLLSDINVDIESKKNLISNIDKNISIANGKLSNEESKLSEIVNKEKQCPLCGSEMTVEHIMSLNN